jgi:hypothetical protein
MGRPGCVKCYPAAARGRPASGSRSSGGESPAEGPLTFPVGPATHGACREPEVGRPYWLSAPGAIVSTLEIAMPRSPHLPRRAAARPTPAAPDGGRRHSRFLVNLPVCCTPIGRDRRTGWRGRTADVSGGGIAVELPTRLPPRTRITLEVRTGIGPLRMEAAVLWTRKVAGRPGVIRHGLCLADRSELLALPVGVLLGQWLKTRAGRPATRSAGAGSAARPRVSK